MVDGTSPVASGNADAGKVTAMTFADLLANNAALSGEVRRSHEALKIAQLTIDKMKVELAYLRRMKYGRSSEKLEHAQLELVGGQVAQPVVMPDPQDEAGEHDDLKSNVTSLDKERKKREPKLRPGLRELPAHLPRRTVVHTAAGRVRLRGLRHGLREIGQDVSEVLDYEPGTFHVVRHVRPEAGLRAAATRSRKRWRRAGRWTAAWQAPDCSRTCAGEQVRRPYCRCTGCARSMPARVSSWSARPSPTGSARRHGC